MKTEKEIKGLKKNWEDLIKEVREQARIYDETYQTDNMHYYITGAINSLSWVLGLQDKPKIRVSGSYKKTKRSKTSSRSIKR